MEVIKDNETRNLSQEGIYYRYFLEWIIQNYSKLEWKIKNMNNSLVNESYNLTLKTELENWIIYIKQLINRNETSEVYNGLWYSVSIYSKNTNRKLEEINLLTKTLEIDDANATIAYTYMKNLNNVYNNITKKIITDPLLLELENIKQNMEDKNGNNER